MDVIINIYHLASSFSSDLSYPFYKHNYHVTKMFTGSDYIALRNVSARMHILGLAQKKLDEVKFTTI